MPGENEQFKTYVRKVRWPNLAVIHNYHGLRDVLQDTSPDILLAVEEPYSLLTLSLLEESRRRGIPFVFHSYQDLYKRYPPPFCWAQRRVLKGARLALAANRSVEQVLRRKGFTGPVVLYPYGVDTDQFSPAPSRRTRDIRIGYVGRFVPEKGVDLLIRATQRLPERVRIVLVGDGPERDRLAVLAHSLDVHSRIDWMGTLPHGRLPGLYRELDILVLPSRTTGRWQEQFGRVLVEAMACGTVVVGSTCGAIPEVVGRAGLIFPEGDAAALADCLTRLVQSPSLRLSYAERGRARVLSMYTHQRCAEILSEALLGCLDRTGT